MARRALRRLRAPRMRSPRAPRAHGGLTRTAPAFVPPQAWKRGWFPRNVSDVAALEALKVCDEGALPLAPTVPPDVVGKTGSWFKENLMALVIGAAVGAATAAGAAVFLLKSSIARATTTDADYHEMARSS